MLKQSFIMILYAPIRNKRNAQKTIMQIRNHRSFKCTFSDLGSDFLKTLPCMSSVLSLVYSSR